MNESPTNEFCKHWINLASAKLGAVAVRSSDEFFAPMQRMLNDQPPQFVDGKYDAHGKWMDGWETRRKRVAGYDWCVVKLAKAGVIHGLEIDTTHFTGNYPPAASVEACHCADDEPPPSMQWRQVLAKTDLRGDRQAQFAINDAQVYTHVRLNIFPDGGIARLRVYAEPKVDWDALADEQRVDLSATLNGAVALCCNDQHFGSIHNLLSPGRAVNMGDGWETRRRREPGYDWAIIALAHLGVIKKIEVDTAHFKGNYPDCCSLQAAKLAETAPQDLPQQSETWEQLLPQMKLESDRIHQFEQQIAPLGAVTHVRLNIYPDGGISRLRLFGAIR